eukprot:gene19457-26119_t
MSAETQVLVKFVTKLPVELKVPESALAVPATLKRYGLSQVINHLLGLDPPRPFDFLVNGELLRKTLEHFLLEKEISAEATLEIEYVPAVVPPKNKDSLPHDDCWGKGVAVSGCYDGNIRLWKAGTDKLECTLVLPAHPGGVNAVACIPHVKGAGLIASAGKDQTLKLWKLSDAEGATPTADCIASYSDGHTDAVQGLAVSPSGSSLVSCGWDGKIVLWRTGTEVMEAAAEAAESGAKPKKRKGADAASAPAVSEAPLRTLEGHLHCVSSVSYPTDAAIYSGGWDHSVRRWDVETGIYTDTYNGSKMPPPLICPLQGLLSSVLIGGPPFAGITGHDKEKHWQYKHVYRTPDGSRQWPGHHMQSIFYQQALTTAV